MKIENYRLFILSFVTASFILLTGFEKTAVNTLPQPEQQAALNELKEAQPKSKASLVKPKKKRTKNKQKAVSVPTTGNSAFKDAERQKPLDLSMPFKDAELTAGQNRAAQQESLNMFASEKKKLPQPLNLDGQMLMSQEPEGDKQKSLDGAGIIINLKR